MGKRGKDTQLGIIIESIRDPMSRLKVIRRHTDLDVYKYAFDLAMRLYKISKEFPADERYSLTDQIRRSSRSVCANLAEAWRKRRYPASFIYGLGVCEAEAAETQTWIQFARECGYLSKEEYVELKTGYDSIISMFITMIRNPQDWSL